MPRIQYVYSAGEEFVLIGETSVYVGTPKRLRRIGIVGRGHYRDGGSSQIDLAGGGDVFSPSGERMDAAEPDEMLLVGPDKVLHRGPTFRESSTSMRTALTQSNTRAATFRNALRAAR